MGLFDWLKKKESPAAKDLPPAAGGARNWKVGDRVLAKWHDDFFYPGLIRGINGGNCQVQFDDGDVAWVHAAHIFRPDIQVGGRVFARVQHGPAYAPGVVSQQKGESIQVRYDHGEDEWTSISFVRVQRPIANIGGEALAPGQTPGGPVKQQLDLGEPVPGSDWRVGDRVLARWLDFYWYPGTILGMGQKGHHVLFDDGDQRVVQENYLMPLVVEEGEHLFIRPKSEPQRVYAPAVVLRVAGETLDVEFEDGTHETNTRVTRARLWRCPVGIRALTFDEGDRVLAFDMDNFIYPAEIVSIQDDKVIVQFLDGPERMLTPELIRKFDLRAGAKVECRWKGAPNYFAGTLRQLDGERVFIKYDDGDEEWTSIRLVRLPNPQAGP